MKKATSFYFFFWLKFAETTDTLVKGIDSKKKKLKTKEF